VADGLFSSDYGLALVKATAALQPCFESLFYSIDIYYGLALNILSIMVAVEPSYIAAIVAWVWYQQLMPCFGSSDCGYED